MSTPRGLFIDRTGLRFEKTAFYSVYNYGYFSGEPYIMQVPRGVLLRPEMEVDRHVWVDMGRAAEVDEARPACEFGNLSHLRQPQYSGVSGDAFGGGRLYEFIPDMGIGYLIITNDFAKRLRETNLSGFSLVPCEVLVNQSGVVLQLERVLDVGTVV